MQAVAAGGMELVAPVSQEQKQDAAPATSLIMLIY